MRRALRWIRRVVLGLLALVVVAIGAVLIAIHTDWGREQIRQRVVVALREQFPGGVEVARVEGSVLGELSLRGVVVRDAAGRPAITADRVQVDLGLRSLIAGTIEVEELVIDRLAVDVRVEPGGVNLATIHRASDEPMTRDVLLPHIRVRRGAVAIDRGDGVVEHLDDLEVAAAVILRTDGAVDASLQLDARARERAAALAVTASARVGADGSIVVSAARVAAGAVELTATDVAYRGPADARGALAVRAPEGELARLAPELGLPAFPLAVTAAVEPAAGGALRVTLGGEVAAMTLEGALIADPGAARPRIDGALAVARLDLARLGPALPPSALAASVELHLAIDPDAAGLRTAAGTIAVAARGTLAKVALDEVTARAELDGTGAAITLHGRGAGGAVLDGAGRLVDGERLTLRDGRVTASVPSIAAVAAATRDLTGATPARGRPALDGAATLALDVTGAFGGGQPPALDARLSAQGRRLRLDDVRIAAVDVTAAASGPPDALLGDARVTTRDASRAGAALPDAIITARGGVDRPIDVTVDATDAARGVTAAIAARVTVGGDDPRQLADVVLGRYRIAAARTELAGSGGRVTIEDRQIRVRDLRASAAGGRVAVDLTAGTGPRAGQLAGTVAVERVDLARLRSLPGAPPHLAGTIDLRADLTRRGRAFAGEILGSAHALVVTAGAGPVDAALSIDVAPERVELAVSADGAELGRFTAAFDVTPPRRLDDVVAWTRLERSALRTVRLDASALDLARMAQLVGQPPQVEGTLDANLAIDADQASLAVHGRRLITPALPAPLDVDVTLDLTDPVTAAATAKATLREIGTASLTTQLGLPARPFDPAAWAALDRRAVRAVEVTIDEIAVDDAMALRLGIPGVRGRVAGKLLAEPGLGAVAAHVDARDVIAGPLAAPAALTIDVGAGRGGTVATATVGLAGATALALEARSPTPLGTLLDGVDPLAVPLDGTVRFPDSELPAILRALGQREIRGQLRGEGTLAGSLGAPTATLTVAIANLGSRIPRGGGEPRGGVRALTLDARYQRGAIHAELRGRQDDGGTLALTGDLAPARLADAHVTLAARTFQVSPLLRLIPDLPAGFRGVLDADLTVRGLDPRTARATGSATLRGGQAPLTDTLGNLRNATLALTLQGNDLHLTADGAIESGQVSVAATGALDGLLPRSGQLDVTVRSLSLINTLAPRFDGKLHVDLSSSAGTWTAKARLRGARVVIPDEEGRELHRADLPPDLVFTTDTRVGVPVPRTRARALREYVGVRPVDPFLIVPITVEPVEVVSSQFRGEVTTKDLALTIGTDGAAIDGAIVVPRGNVVIFERRYTMTDAAVVFDGGLDPRLQLTLEYDFPQLTMKVVMAGRYSAPRLELSSNPGTYTEGQLLGFLLGGAPGAVGRETADAGIGAAAAVTSQLVGGFVTRRLPIRVDVLNYEPSSSSSSGAFVLGRWITQRALLLFRTRVEARADENVSEAELQYWLSQRLLLEGSYGDRGVLGGDLLWNRRW